MRRRPRFTALAVATLALGIGVNTGAFAVAYGIIVRPLPYPEPSRLVIVNLLFADGGDLGLSPESATGCPACVRCTRPPAITGARSPSALVTAARSSAAYVTDRSFDVLGVPAEVGRPLVAADSPAVVALRRRIPHLLGPHVSDPLGALVAVSDEARVIGGVMPPDFAFPDDEIALWVPSRTLVPGTRPEDTGYSKIVARLKPGATLDHVRDDARRILRELGPKDGVKVSVTALGESVVEGMRTLLAAAVAGGLLVLLVACANVATLFIGRNVSRQRELAARIALGATRTQLVRSVLVEALLIAALASVAGLALSAATLKVFLAQAAGALPGLHRVAMDLPVLGAIAVLTVVATLLCERCRRGTPCATTSVPLCGTLQDPARARGACGARSWSRRSPAPACC